MSGQHFAVGIDVDPLAFGLLEQDFQVFQVVAGNQNSLALPGPQRHLGRRRMTINASVAGIEQLHGPEINFSAFEDQTNPII